MKLQDRSHAFVDKTISWIMGITLVMLMLSWAVHLIYNFWRYLWR